MSGCDIVLATQNATWSHPAFGLRCLRANLGPLREQCGIVELDPRASAEVSANAILRFAPRIVGLGVYIWNVARLTDVAHCLKERRPDLILVLGGPEISYEWATQPIATSADYIVREEGEMAFADLCARLLGGRRPRERVVEGGRIDLTRLCLPYDEYTDEDLATRFTYIETTRGCPYGCAFCLSSLDRVVREWPLERVFEAFDALVRRGARRFKFVDRSFNLDADHAAAVLQFVLDRLRPGLTVHFEFTPHRIPDTLQRLIARFPPGSLRVEVGIQTFDETVHARIGRRQSTPTAEETLRFLCEETAAHVHADLIAGLPGGTLAQTARDFDHLLAFGPAEIQVGILKRLRGTPIARHAAEWGLKFDPTPPYPILETPHFPADDLARVARLARYWERLGNRREFPNALPLLWRDGRSPFEALMNFADSLFRHLGATHGIPLEQYACALFERLTSDGLPVEEAARIVRQDYACGRHRRRPPRALRRHEDRSRQ